MKSGLDNTNISVRGACRTDDECSLLSDYGMGDVWAGPEDADQTGFIILWRVDGSYDNYGTVGYDHWKLTFGEKQDSDTSWSTFLTVRFGTLSRFESINPENVAACNHTIEKAFSFSYLTTNIVFNKILSSQY